MGPTAAPAGDGVVVGPDGIAALVDVLRSRGLTVVGPTVRDGAIVPAELESAAELPYGWGVELEAGLQLSSLWQANASLGLVRATYDTYAGRAGDGAVVKPGNRIEKTPAHTLTVGLQYGAGTGFYARGDVRGQGRRYFNPENTTRDGAFVTVDLKGGYQTGPWDLYAYVRNLTAAEYRTSVNPQGSGSLVTFGEPRRLGVGARYRF